MSEGHDLDGSPPAASVKNTASQSIGHADLNDALADDRARPHIFDVRYRSTRTQRGYIPTSRPLDRDNPVELERAIDRGDQCVVYCESTAGAQAFFDQHPHLVSAKLLDGGFIAWNDAGHKVEGGPQ